MRHLENNYPSKEEKTCPVCESENTRPDFDYPENIRCCKSCLADYRFEDGEILLDPREAI